LPSFFYLKFKLKTEDSEISSDFFCDLARVPFIESVVTIMRQQLNASLIAGNVERHWFSPWFSCSLSHPFP